MNQAVLKPSGTTGLAPEHVRRDIPAIVMQSSPPLRTESRPVPRSPSAGLAS